MRKLGALQFRIIFSGGSGVLRNHISSLSAPTGLLSRNVNVYLSSLSSCQLYRHNSEGTFNSIKLSSLNTPVVRHFSANQASCQQRKSTSSSGKSLQESTNPGQVTLSLGEKVKENTKTVGYGGVIVIGVLVLGAMLYTIVAELFSSNSPNNIYTRSFKICKNNPEVQDVLGHPIKCYGEETRRGWRRHVAHTEFLKNNEKHLRMRFYVEGTFRKGTVHVDKKQNANGNYDYEYLIVDVDGYPPRRINLDVTNF